MKKMFLLLGTLSIGMVYAQSGSVGINTATPNATLDVKVSSTASSTSNQGLLIPRMSNVRAGDMLSPEISTLVYINSIGYPIGSAPLPPSVSEVNAPGFYYFNGTKWVKLGSDGGSYIGSNSVLIDGNTIKRAALTGDVTAATDDNTVTVTGLRGKEIANTAPSTHQILKWNGSQWAPANDEDAQYTGSASIVIGSNNSIQRQALTGDVQAAQNNNTVTVTGLRGKEIANTAPSTHQILKWNGSQWTPANDEDAQYTGSASIVIGSNNSIQRQALTGDVQAAQNNNTVTVTGLRGKEIANTVPSTNQVLKWNGSQWAPANDQNTTYTAGAGIAIQNNVISATPSSGTSAIKWVSSNYSLQGSDNKGYILTSSVNPITITVSNTLPIGFSCIIIQKGGGQVTVIGNGVSVYSARGNKTRVQHSAIGIIKEGQNSATITGDAINN